MNKQELLKAVSELENEYDAYLMMNRYSHEEGKNTHAKHFKLLAELKGDKVPNALAWIHDCYDCYYKNELNEDSPFNYLRETIEQEFSKVLND